MEIKRDKYLNMLKLRKHNGMIKVITGIRRCGKSYLLNTIFYNELIKNGIDENHIIRFAFDSADDLVFIGEDLQKLTEKKQKVNPNKFMDYINRMIIDKEMYYLLLDEIQNLGSFEIVLNGYLRKNNLDVYVTGSNSKFLSKDVITEFAGRGDEIHVLPLSFSEFYSIYSSSKKEAFDDYMVYGGLPAVALMQNDEQKSKYLQIQIANLYLRDIIIRYNLLSNNDLSELFDVIASGISTLTNPNKLSNTFTTIKKSKLSAVTIDKLKPHTR